MISEMTDSKGWVYLFCMHCYMRIRSAYTYNCCTTHLGCAVVVSIYVDVQYICTYACNRLARVRLSLQSWYIIFYSMEMIDMH